MNLSEALDAALPEMPKTRLERGRPPRIDPNLVIREDVLDGEPIIGVLQRDKSNFFRFSPSQWQMAQLFDGARSYEEIAALYTEQSGAQFSGDDIRIFAESLDQSDFWYKTPQEKNIAMNERLMAQRGRRAQRSSKINLAHISFSAWDPNRYLTALDNLVGKYIYNKWSVLAVVLLFCFEATIFIGKWSIIGPDVPLYYNFTRKSFYDIAEFWVLLFILGFIHESAHGLTCKHYGGEVHQMGLMFLYMTPAFFVDVTETWVSATRVQRLATIIAGIWVEMVICGLAMIVWLNSAAGQWIHEFTYKVILITGLAVIVMNLNPLLKLDGYYFLTETMGIPDLKERSTAFVSGWVQKYVLRLPIDLPAVPRRRVPLFAVYALVSGAYSYLLLYFFIRFVYNMGANWLAEFALIPAGMLAFVMFRSRLRSLKSLSGQLWERNFGESFRIKPIVILAVVLLLALIFAPILRDREGAYFVVEPQTPATVYAAVPGRVESVLVREGQSVHAGQILLRMSSSYAAEISSSADAANNAARSRAFESELRGQSIGTAAAEQESATRSSKLAQDAQSSLLITAPLDGVVLTGDPDALRGQFAGAGQALISLASAGPRAVRIYIPVSELDRIPIQADVALALPDSFSILRMKLAPMDSAAVSLPAGLIPHQDYRGVELPTFYSARMTLPASAGSLPLGAGGRAQIFGGRRSLFEHFIAIVLNLFHGHVW